jgi:hypothetical protein
MLEHLVVLPRGGLCNRLRAIASAKRLASRSGARCTVIWDWGRYDALFDDGSDWLPYAAPMEPGLLMPGYHHIRHLGRGEGGATPNRRVPVTTHPGVVVDSPYVFYAEEEALPKHLPEYESGVIGWVPKPQSEIIASAAAFREARLPPGTVGMHVRRTDNKAAADRSPDAAFFAAGDREVEKGHSIFLATDNRKTLEIMRDRYGDRLLHYPKRSALDERWPRQTTEPADVADDLVDLRLLVGCEHVVGSAASSFSRVAVLLNGSPDCTLLDRPYGRFRRFVRRQRRSRLGSS